MDESEIEKGSKKLPHIPATIQFTPVKLYISHAMEVMPQKCFGIFN